MKRDGMRTCRILIWVVLHSMIGQKMCESLFKNAAITANGKSCASVGKRMIERGGSVADACIATMLCDGVTSSERMGIGGGFILLIYNHALHKTEVLVSREVAPLLAHKDMYSNNSDKSLFGGLAVAVPGELRGYWELHKRYGKLPWSVLFEPAIRICEEGVEAGPFVTKCLHEYEKNVMNSPSLRAIFGNYCQSFSDSKPKIYRHQLARTLRLVAQKGPDALYNGELTQDLVNDINSNGGMITRDDLKLYKPYWTTPLELTLPGNLKVFAPPPPASGAVLLLILNVLSRLTPAEDSINSWQEYIETLKYAYAFRTKLGDSRFSQHVNQVVTEMLSDETAEMIAAEITKMRKTSNNYEHYGAEYEEQSGHGTAHLNFLHPNGDAITVTSSINALFGAMFRSESTGIMLNNHMNDFSLPGSRNKYGVSPSPVNFIAPGKHPLSSVCPTIVLDQNWNVKMLVGAAGGTKIISAVSIVLIKALWRHMHISQAINEPRLHHQLLPMKIFYESEFDQSVLNYLRSLGHEMEEIQKASAVSAVIKKGCGCLQAAGDYRRSYSADGL